MQQTAHSIKRIIDHLERDRLLTAGQTAAAMAHHQRSGIRIEEAILELSLIEEGLLLRSLASLYHTKFVGTERLANLNLDASLTSLVPRKYADQYNVCPVSYDGDRGLLGVVTPDADSAEVVDGVRLSSSAREVRVFVVRPAAAKAMIARLYSGDPHAFALLERETFSRSAEVSLGSPPGDSLRPGSGERASVPPPTEPVHSANRRRLSERPGGTFGSSPTLSALGSFGSMPGTNPTANLVPGPRTTDALRESIARLLGFLSARDNLNQAAHPHHTARIAKRLAERLVAPQATVQAVELAAFIHDLGKSSAGHLSTFNVAQYAEYTLIARHAYANPVRLFEGAKLPLEVVAALQHMYERVDGKGFPLGQRGREIPLAARILAVADAYADLTESSENAYRRRLSTEEASGVIVSLSDTIFDPTVVEALTRALISGPSRAAMSPPWDDLLIVESSADDAFLLRAAALDAGFLPAIVHTSDAARAALSAARYALLIVNTDDDPWSLLQDLKAGLLGESIPFGVVGRSLERSVIERLTPMGPIDIAPKALAPAALFERMRQALDPIRTRGVAAIRGKLQDVELPDVLQSLIQGRQTGRLVVRSAGGVGEIHFSLGAIVGGFFGERLAEEAVVALVRLREGEFAFDGSFKPGPSRIKTPTEMLLLDAMRRIDDQSLRPRS